MAAIILIQLHKFTCSRPYFSFIAIYSISVVSFSCVSSSVISTRTDRFWFWNEEHWIGIRKTGLVICCMADPNKPRSLPKYRRSDLDQNRSGDGWSSTYSIEAGWTWPGGNLTTKEKLGFHLVNPRNLARNLK